MRALYEHESSSQERGVGLTAYNLDDKPFENVCCMSVCCAERGIPLCLFSLYGAGGVRAARTSTLGKR